MSGNVPASPDDDLARYQNYYLRRFPRLPLAKFTNGTYAIDRLIRAKPFALQSEPYRNLEYFLTHMSNGIPYHGPSPRK